MSNGGVSELDGDGASFMNSSLLRNFLHRSRQWARATRGAQLFEMAARDLAEIAEVDSGFFVYQKRWHAEEGIRVYVPWGVFAGREAALQGLLEEVLQEPASIEAILERWLLAEDIPDPRIRGSWANDPLLEIGVWPLYSRERMNGALVAARTKSVSSLLTPETSVALMDTCAAQVSLALDLILTGRIAEDASQRDLLTGVLNRRGLEARLPGMLAGAEAAGQTLMFALIDVNDLKALNDVHGHPAGDAALHDIAQRLVGEVGSTGIVARIGGDEFAALSRVHAADGAAFERALQAAVVSPRHACTVSVGTAVWGIDGETLESCYEVADGRLYEQKRRRKSLISR
ncbi:MAG: GGDEF domain-containing protein [Alicyclobacillus sp.]|nr:GGDEF domain-containing protein [Alicyclobacillus sp.]